MFMDEIYYKWLANERIEKQSKTTALRMNVKLLSGTMYFNAAVMLMGFHFI